MAAHRRVLQHKQTQIESPAKVFAKLKSKVEQETHLAAEWDFRWKNPPSIDRHGGDGARSRAEDNCRFGEGKANRMLGVEARALTLSPIRSPQKNCPRWDTPNATRAGEPLASVTPYTPTKRPLMESTALFHHKLSNAENMEGFSYVTPKKKVPGEDSCALGVRGRHPTEEPLPPANMFSPSRRSTLDLHQGMKVMASQPTEDPLPDPRDPRSRDALWSGLSLPADSTQLTHEATLAQPRSIARTTGCAISLMSPAKMFAAMKDRESRREQGEAHKVSSSSSSTRGHDAGRSRPLSPASSADGMEDDVFTNESPDRRSDTSPQPLLLQDPVVLETPRVSIPKKNSNRGKDARQRDGAVHLKKWFLRRNHRGLFVDGLLKDEGIPWNSNIIVETVSRTVLKTISGSVYILVGKMKVDLASDFPSWFLKKFANGFPSNWKELYEKFLSEKRGTRGQEAATSGRGGRRRTTKTEAEASSLKAARKSQQQASSRTPTSCPSASFCSSNKVSRSGRVIKPPLEYWKGGRVMLDADMNVTIFECYDTSICKPEVSQAPRIAEVLHPRPAPRRSVKDPPSRPKRVRVPLQQEGGPLHHPPEPVGRTPAASEAGARRSQRIVKQKSPDTEPPPLSLARPGRAAHNDHTSSDEDISVKRRRPGRAATKRPGKTPEGKEEPRVVLQRLDPRRSTKTAPPTGQQGEGQRNPPAQQQEDSWTRPQQAASSYPRRMAGHWTTVTGMEGVRSADEGRRQCATHTHSAAPTKKTSKTSKARRDEREAGKEPEKPVISARAGTLRRKQQVRHFLETMPKDDMDDVFSSGYMQNQRFEMPSVCPSEEHDFTLGDLEPVSPTTATGFPEVKTPQCLHITPGMLGSPSSNNDDKYVYQLQKRMRKKQFSVHKRAPASKSFTPTPSLRRSMRRCGTTENGTFLVWEMFSEKDEAPSDSGEEEDFYFTDED